MTQARTPTSLGATAPAMPLEPGAARGPRQVVLVALPEWTSPLAVGVAHLLEGRPDVRTVPITTALAAPGRGVLLHDAAAPVSTYSEAAQLAREAAWHRLALAWPEEQRRLLRCPASGPEPDGWLPKGADGPALVAALRHAVSRAPRPVSGPGTTTRCDPSALLSDREEQMLVLIAAGLSNDEIAARCYLSINSVKTFIRSAYRKIGVERRVEAALWVADHLDTSGAGEPRPEAV